MSPRTTRPANTSLKLAIAVMSYLTLSGAGCVPESPAPTVAPARRCMQPVAPIPRPAVGEEAKAYQARLIDHAKAESSKTRCLQKFAKTVTE